jgi:hypothetical protein
MCELPIGAICCIAEDKLPTTGDRYIGSLRMCKHASTEPCGFTAFKSE